MPLLPGWGTPDVALRLGTVEEPEGVLPARGVGPLVRHPGDVVFRTAGIGRCSVRDGTTVVVDPSPGVTDDELRQWLLGRVFSVLLHQRGLFILHGDTVDVDGRAVAFIGNSGQGKSTTAAAFCAAGHALVSEDVTAIDGADVLAGYPMLKLHPAGAEALGLGRVLEHAHPSKPKVAISMTEGFSPRRRPFACAYLVTDGDAVRTHALSQQEAAMVLLQNAYCAPYFDDDQAPAFLAATSRLARAVPVRRIERPRSFDALNDVIELVKGELRASRAR